MDYVEKEGLSVPEAVFSACLALGIEEKDAQVQVLSEPGARRVKVRVGRPGVELPPVLRSPSAPASPTLAKPADYMPRPSARPRPSAEQAEVLRGLLEELLELMGTPGKIEIKEHAGNLVFNITAEKDGLLIGKRGMTLEALQVVAEEMLSAASGDPALYAVVDVADYRYRKERKLMDQARELAARVLASGGQEVMGPLDPAERRVVHLELKQMPDIETFSVGEGVRKKVIIQRRR